MGTFCKTCDQRVSENNNEIIGDISDTVFSISRKNKMNKIKERINSDHNLYHNNSSNLNNINEYIPQIIFLQRKIKKYLSSKHESNQDLFYNKLYSNNIPSNRKLKEELGMFEIKTTNLKHSENYKTLSQKYNTISNNSLINNSNEGKPYKVNKIQINENAIYTGQILNGKQHGYGIQEWSDGAKYEGEWENGRTNGYGTFYHPGGDIYKGYWKDDKANGRGVYTSIEGIEYDGEWKDDCQDGYGIEKWNDGSKYKGHYKKGKKEGYGEYYWTDGSIYKGSWINNNHQGYGKYYWPDKKYYEGFFKDNALEGKGHYHWPDNRDFVGEFKIGKKSGLGKYVWPDGRSYVGFWEKGKQHGMGKYIDENNCEKFGMWLCGKRNRWLDDTEINILKRQNDEYYRQIMEFNPNNYIFYDNKN